VGFGQITDGKPEASLTKSKVGLEALKRMWGELPMQGIKYHNLMENW
jgi:hypothetical protein